MNFFGMKQMFLTIIAAASMLLLSQNIVFGQTQQKERSAEEIAAEQADKLATLLDLEGWQVFYVDSTLQHDYAGMMEELKTLQASKVENYDLYIGVRDKWNDKIDAALRKYFNDAQWAKYLKNGAGKAQKDRAKRAEKRNK